MNIKINVLHTTFEKETLDPKSIRHSFRFPLYDKQKVPRYHVALQAVFTDETKTFYKTYHCYYFAADGNEYPFHNKLHFKYDDWIIVTPYVYFPTKQERKTYMRKIKRMIGVTLDNVEKDTILPLEHRYAPILSKATITKETKRSDCFLVTFSLFNQKGTFSCTIVKTHRNKWQLDDICQYKKGNRIAKISPKSVFWLDHIAEQVIDIIRLKSKYRVKYVLTTEKVYFSPNFAKGNYRLDNVKISYQQ